MTRFSTPEQKSEIVAFYESGVTQNELARRYSCSDAAIATVLRNAGVTKRLHAVRMWTGSEEQQAEVLRRYAAGDSVKVIAKHVGCRTSEISETLARHNAPVRLAGPKHQRFPGQSAHDLAAEYEAGATLEGLAEKHSTNTATVRNTLARVGTQTRSARRGVFWTDERVAEMVRRYEGGESQQAIADSLGVNQTVVSMRLINAGVVTRSRKRGAAHPAWRGGRRVAPGGYVWVRPDEDDLPLVERLSNGYVFEHRLVMARALGRQLLKSETVHHINGDRADNRLANLQLRQGNHGKGVRMQCNACGSHDVVAVSLP